MRRKDPAEESAARQVGANLRPVTPPARGPLSHFRDNDITAGTCADEVQHLPRGHNEIFRYIGRKRRYVAALLAVTTAVEPIVAQIGSVLSIRT